MAKNDNPYRTYCEQRAAAHQLRRLQDTQILPHGYAVRGGKKLLNFGGNDYLGLSQHPLLIQRAREFAEKFGAGSTASRLITGNAPVYAEIEQRLARGKGYEAALVMSSGYQANLTVLAALADAEVIGRPVTVLADRLCHNSILQGIMLSGARLMRFHHNDTDHLENLLRAQAGKDAHLIIVSESVFGMDGDCGDIKALGALAQKYEAMLYIDEAHATGALGPDGFGLCAAHKGTVDIAMGTFGKGLGSFGAYIACSHTIRDYLIQRCGGLIYSTALPPPVLGAIEAALALLPQLQNERVYLQAQSARLRRALQNQGWNCGASATHIIPIILGDEQAATTLAEILFEAGLFAPAIRPPTVPRGSSRLRLSLSAVHKAQDIDRLIAAMQTQAENFAAPRALAS
jgi:8-amino-7-oxononanoate synthase